MSTGNPRSSQPCITARPELDGVPLAVHGGLDRMELARLGLDPERIVDFSTNVNPFAPEPPPLTGGLGRYPDDHCSELRALLAEAHAVPEGRLAFGNGAAELISLLAFAYVRPGDRAAVLTPTYGDYARALSAAGASVERISATLEDDFRHDLAAVASLAEGARILFVCTPNNPTGVSLGAGDLARLARRLPATLIVVDESYADLAIGPETDILELVRSHGNVVSLRSMTKAFALAGARLGYLVASPVVVEAIERVRPSWNVGAVAQHAGAWCLRRRGEIDASLAQLRAAADAFFRSARGAGFAIRPSSSAFFLIDVGDARAVRAALLEHGILVRDCTSFGLPRYIRIGARDERDGRRLIEALGAVLA